MCDVDDFCAAALAAIERRASGNYNICAERIGESLRADLEEFIARVGSRARVVGDARLGRPGSCCRRSPRCAWCR